MSVTEEDIKILKTFISDKTGLIPSSVECIKDNIKKITRVSIRLYKIEGIKFSELIHKTISVLKQLDKFTKHTSDIFDLDVPNNYITLIICLEDNENLSDIITLCKLTL